MIYKKTLFLANAGIVTILLCAASFAAHAETLSDAVVASLNNHPRVEAAIANRDAYTSERREEWSNYLPQLSVRAGAGRGYSDNSTSRGLATVRGAAYSWLWEGSATLTQPLFDGFKTVNRVGAADSRMESAGYNIVDVRENLALSTVVSYLDVLRSREAVAAIKKHGQKIDDYVRRIEKMVKEGAADKSMIAQARDIKAQLDTTLADMEGQQRNAFSAYAEAVGHLPEDKLEKPDLAADLIPINDDEAVEVARGRHPALRAARYTEEALANEAEAAREFYYPKVNGELSYNERDQKDDIGGESIDRKAMVRVNWDFSLGGGQIARAKKSRYRYMESRAQHAEKERQVEKLVRTAYSDYETAADQMKILKDRLKINEDIFKNYEAQFEGARINLLQLLQADNALFNAKLSLMGGEYRLVAAKYALLAGMGSLQSAMNITPVADNGG